ncbi:MAG: segregation/condensation protein A [Rhodothermales bacterium]
MYRISLQDFEGPLDLLLFFIRRDELDVFNIPIAQIADEYLEYVRLLEQIDLDSVGDFLYMAALLINIKARMLLPKEELDEDGEPIDPRRELVERLLEYVRFKEASSNLTELEAERAERFTRGHAASERKTWEDRTDVSYDASVFDLITALKKILTEAPEEPTHAVAREEYTIEEQQVFILDHLDRAEKISFARTMRGRSKPFIITTFLGVLELARQQRVSIYVPEDEPLDFYLVRRDEADDGSEGSAEKEEPDEDGGAAEMSRSSRDAG